MINLWVTISLSLPANFQSFRLHLPLSKAGCAWLHLSTVFSVVLHGLLCLLLAYISTLPSGLEPSPPIAIDFVAITEEAVPQEIEVTDPNLAPLDPAPPVSDILPAEPPRSPPEVTAHENPVSEQPVQPQPPPTVQPPDPPKPPVPILKPRPEAKPHVDHRPVTPPKSGPKPSTQPANTITSVPTTPITSAPPIVSHPTVTNTEVARDYGREVWSRIIRHKPRKVSLQGTTIINFSVTPEGSLIAVNISQTSGDTTLDEKAVAAVRAAAPFPTPPPNVAPDQLVFTISFDFK